MIHGRVIRKIGNKNGRFGQDFIGDDTFDWRGTDVVDYFLVI